MIKIREDLLEKIRKVKERSGGAETVARFYGLQINSRSHRAICPFHPHRNGTPGENLSFYGGGFICFVCGAKGSALDYVQRLFQYSTITKAAQRIDADMNMNIFRTGPQIRETRAQTMSSDYSVAAEKEWDILSFLRFFYTLFYNAQENAVFALELERDDAELKVLFATSNEKRAEAQRIANIKSKELDKIEALYVKLPSLDRITDDQLFVFWEGGCVDEHLEVSPC